MQLRATEKGSQGTVSAHCLPPVYPFFSDQFQKLNLFLRRNSGTVSAHWQSPVYPFSLTDTHSRTYWISVNRGCGVWRIKSYWHRYLTMHYNQEKCVFRTSNFLPMSLSPARHTSTTWRLLNVGLPTGKCVETHSIINAQFHKLLLLQRDRGAKKHSNFLSPPAPLFPLT